MLRAYFEVLLAVREIHALADVALHYEVPAFGIKEHLDAVVHEVVLYAEVYVVRLLGTHVPYRAIHKFEARLNRTGADLADFLFVADTLYVLVGAELEVDLIRIVYRLLRQALANERGQVSANFAGQRQLAV